MPLNFEKLERYTAELRDLFPGYSYTFKCPICFRDFDIQQKKIIDAHIVPQSLGGRLTTFSCVECDSRIGHDIEGPIINFLLDGEVLEGRRVGKVRGGETLLRIDNREYRARISVAKKGQIMVNLPNPYEYAYFLEHDAQNMHKSQIIYDWSGRVSDEKITPLFLKMAYLAAFDTYGYRYIYHHELNWVRYILNSIKGYRIPYKCSFIPKDSLMNLLPTKLEYCFCPMKMESWIAPTFMWKICVVVLPPFRDGKPRQFTGYGLESGKTMTTSLNFDVDDNPVYGELTFDSVK